MMLILCKTLKNVKIPPDCHDINTKIEWKTMIIALCEIWGTFLTFDSLESIRNA